jgi:ELWxxDGT repeat protein
MIQTFASAIPSDSTMSGGKAYFTVLNAAGAKELWVSNGTTAGTLLLKEITAPGGKFTANYLTDVLGTLNFLVGDDASGTQTLWKTNGTVAGTQPVVEFPQLPFSKIASLKSFTGTLLFSLDDGIHGAEPWILPRGPIVDPLPISASHRIFYNQSMWDGNSASIQPASDNAAIATDKTPYLPGSGIAVFNNVTSFSRGITGIMVDLTAAGIHAGVTAADFTLKVGNNNAPNTWAAAPAPSAVSVVLGGGASGSDRVYITWPQGSIVNQWLEVRVLPTANTGLIGPSIVFWGNKIGDSGTSSPAGTFESTSTDAAQVFATIGGGKPISDRRDYNRDGQVTSTDAAIVFAKLGSIVRINIGAGGPFAPDAAPAVAIAPATHAFASETDWEQSAANRIVTALAAPRRTAVGESAEVIATALPQVDESAKRSSDLPNQGQALESLADTVISRTIASSTEASDFLAVTGMLDNGDTGLAAPDVFMFGNQPGDSGDKSSDTRVGPVDVMRVVNHLLSSNDRSAAIDSPLDFNRDGQVSVIDLMAAVNQALSSHREIELISINRQGAMSGAIITGGLMAEMPPSINRPVELVEAVIVQPQTATVDFWQPDDDDLQSLALEAAAPRQLMLDPDE